MSELHHIKANFMDAPAGVRRDVFEGREHIVVPVVMICDGVMNGALVTQAEYGRYVEAWNGRPVPIGHPQENGGYISANRPDIIERSIGTVFGARCDDGKLKADLWIDTAKAQRLGHHDLLRTMEAGGLVEISTGYFADDDMTAGQFNGNDYRVIHRNIRPDHLALLPGEIGACSVADGCGTRVNSKRGSLMSKTQEALATLAHALGLKSNCACEEPTMDLIQEAEKLVKANALDPKQLAAVQKMSPADREVMGAFIAALNMAGDQGDPDGMEEDDEPPVNTPAPPMANKEQPKAMTADDINKLVANGVKEGMRRERVMDRLTANERNAFSEDQLAAMSTDALDTYEKSIRPTDYSGGNGFAANSDAIDANVTPLGTGGGLMGRYQKKGA